MTDFKDIKVGDYVRITDTSVYEGEVLWMNDEAPDIELDTKGIIDCNKYGDNHSVTIEVVEKPREIGWWEAVTSYAYRDQHTALRWDGEMWFYSNGQECKQGEPVDITPLHYIGKGSQG